MSEKSKRNIELLRHSIFPADQEDHLQSFVEHTANRIEKRLGERYESSGNEAPLYTKDGEKNTWYHLPISNGLSADGSEYHVYIKEGLSDHLCIFLSGGGMAWNQFTAARPTTAGKMASNQPNYYYSNLRPSTELMNIGGGITDNLRESNPFKDWSFVVITYATGDFHIGNYDYKYKSDNDTDEILHFHGYRNFIEGMNTARAFFPSPDKLLFAGDSAGGFAVSALSRELVEDWYPDCENIYVLSDAAMLNYDHWEETIRDTWHAKPSFYENLQTGNITLEWYRKLIEAHPGRVQCLYSGSIKDYLLTTYYNDLKNKEFKTDAESQELYHMQLKEMVGELQKIDPSFGFFIHDFRMPLTTGTVHTAVRRNWFYLRTFEGKTIAQWLDNAVNGKVENVGLQLL